jgi:GNAT superfamily N-acetyltransferase
MRPGDLAAADALADRTYPDHFERPEVMAERLALSPLGCFVLEDGGVLAGYLLSHPWAGPPPPLNSLLGALPVDADHYYFHDLALSPDVRGAGHAAALLGRFAGLADIRLMAVGGSAAFWRRQGFSLLPIDRAKQASYGTGAAYMRRVRLGV